MTYKIIGYASTIHLDKHQHVIVSSAWDLTKIKNTPLLFEHNTRALIGYIVSGKITALGLMITAEINSKCIFAKHAIKLISDGSAKFSVGIVPTKYYEDDIRYITCAKLYEISIVTDPANINCCVGFQDQQINCNE